MTSEEDKAYRYLCVIFIKVEHLDFFEMHGQRDISDQILLIVCCISRTHWCPSVLFYQYVYSLVSLIYKKSEKESIQSAISNEFKFE